MAEAIGLFLSGVVVGISGGYWLGNSKLIAKAMADNRTMRAMIDAAKRYDRGAGEAVARAYLGIPEKDTVSGTPNEPSHT